MRSEAFALAVAHLFHDARRNLHARLALSLVRRRLLRRGFGTLLLRRWWLRPRLHPGGHCQPASATRAGVRRHTHTTASRVRRAGSGTTLERRAILQDALALELLRAKRLRR